MKPFNPAPGAPTHTPYASIKLNPDPVAFCERFVEDGHLYGEYLEAVNAGTFDADLHVEVYKFFDDLRELAPPEVAGHLDDLASIFDQIHAGFMNHQTSVPYEGDRYLPGLLGVGEYCLEEVGIEVD